MAWLKMPVATCRSDDGRAGSFRTGLAGGLWVEGVGWMHFADFLKEQGVVEMDSLPMDNPISISASGTEIMGGLAGISFSWKVDLDQVYVCNSGVTEQVGFPGGLREAVAAGAGVGRCEFIQ